MKKVERTITCDGCSEIIEPTKGCDSYFLNLEATNYSIYDPIGVCLAVHVIPPIERDMQFHRLECLKKWVNK